MKDWLYRILLVFFCLTFLISAGFLADYLIKSKKEQTQYRTLSQLVQQAEDTSVPAQTESSTPPDIISTAPDTPAPSSPVLPEINENPKVLPKYAPLLQMNPDLIGWIKIEDTVLDYPVMQSPNWKDYYLTHNFYKESSAHGCVYAQENCDITAPSDNIILYGHNMKDGSMFAVLHNYYDPGFWKAHPVIVFDTVYQAHTYQILSVFRTTSSVGEGFSYHTFVNASDEAAFNRFVADCKALSLYDTGVNAAYGDKLLTLSTCERALTNGRLVVVAKRIS